MTMVKIVILSLLLMGSLALLLFGQAPATPPQAVVPRATVPVQLPTGWGWWGGQQPRSEPGLQAEPVLIFNAELDKASKAACDKYKDVEEKFDVCIFGWYRGQNYGVTHPAGH